MKCIDGSIDLEVTTHHPKSFPVVIIASWAYMELSLTCLLNSPLLTRIFILNAMGFKSVIAITCINARKNSVNIKRRLCFLSP